MSINATWKDDLYHSYVSSQQAGRVGDGGVIDFSSRGPYIKQVISRYIPQDRTITILDIGCGYGAYNYYLHQLGYKNTFGVEYSTEQVEVARKMKVPGIIRSNAVDFMTSLKPQSVDIVLAIDILEHFTRPEALEILRLIAQILKPGGRCIAHVPNAEGIYGMRIRYGDLTHEMAYTPSSARQAFVSAGFTKTTCAEDRPLIYSATSLIRRLIWSVGTLYHRAMLAAETGRTDVVLSQNMIVLGLK